MRWSQLAVVFALAAIAATSCEHASLDQTVLLRLHDGGKPAAGVEVVLSGRPQIHVIKPVDPAFTAADGTFQWRHRMTAYPRSHTPDFLMLFVRVSDEMRPIWSTRHTLMRSSLTLTCDLTPIPAVDVRSLERRQLGLAPTAPDVIGCSAQYGRAFDEMAWLAALLLLGFSVIRVLMRSGPDQRQLEFQLWGPAILCMTVAMLSRRWLFQSWFLGAGSLTAVLWLVLINWRLGRGKPPFAKWAPDRTDGAV